MNLFAWIVVGSISGAMAKAIMPGTQDEPGSWLGTIALGVVGAILGGYLSRFLLGGGTCQYK